MHNPQLKIETPTGQVVPGRGFYQLEEDSLYVQVGTFADSRRFFSWLESNQVRLDIDRQGRLMLIEVDWPRRRWDVDSHLAPPTIAEPADIRWLDFRKKIPEPDLITNEKRTLLLIRFSTSESWRWFNLADSILMQVDKSHQLLAIMITNIKDDLAGRQIAAYRKRIGSDDTPAANSRHPVSSLSG